MQQILWILMLFKTRNVETGNDERKQRTVESADKLEWRERNGNNAGEIKKSLARHGESFESKFI